MITFAQIEQPAKAVNLTATVHSIIVLRINVKSKFIAPAVLQPRLLDWVTDEGNLFTADYKAAPNHIYILPNAEAPVTITIKLPHETKSNINLHTSLQFSAFQNCTLQINVSLTDSTPANDITEHNIDLQIPLLQADDHKNFSGNIFEKEYTAKVMAGLAGLEILPARWVVAELLITLCNRGWNVLQQKENDALTQKIKRTKFFKNLVLVISGSHAIHWIIISMSISSGLFSVVSKHQSAAPMLQTWEEWLISLAGFDIEATIDHPKDLGYHKENNYEILVEKIGMEPEKWTLCLLAGVMEISPKIRLLMEQICERVPQEKVKSRKPASKKVKNIIKEKGSLQK